MAKPDLGRIDVQRLGTDLETWKRGLAEPTARAFERVERYLKNQLTIADNMMAAIVTLTLTHGQEIPFKSPNFAPRGFTVLDAVDATTGAPVQVLGAPYVNRNHEKKQDGWYGITAHQLTMGPYLDVAPVNTQSLNIGAATPITFDGTPITDGSGVISIASNSSGPTATRFVASEAGIYLFTGQLAYAPNGTGVRFCGASKNSNGTLGTRYGQGLVPAAAGGEPTFLSFAWQIPMLANDYMELFGYQTSGGALSTQVGFASSRMQVSRIGVNPLSRPTLRITGILWGG